MTGQAEDALASSYQMSKNKNERFLVTARYLRMWQIRHFDSILQAAF
jgi:hypothetical protein